MPSKDAITSPHNLLIKRLARLQRSPRARREERRFVVEGLRLLREAQAAGLRPEAVLYTPEAATRAAPLLQPWTAQGVALYETAPQALRRASATETPQGVLALFPWPALPWPPTPDFLLVLDDLRDPGNLGTILRTAWAAGVQGVLLPPGNTDPFAPKVLRSGMGAQFHLPLRRATWEEMPHLLAGLPLILAEAHAGTPYTQANFRRPLALLIGGEAHGPGPQARALASEVVHIPMPGGAESLNAAVATAVLLFEVVRQRREAARPLR
ncbi:MAG TPA: RNA methyltransferase [Anaerolineae bacterium]|nr:RNA methyltransferase [Anaerolineae bacterium]HID85298.1 RNA methyltransferase [Anaerolineales bacterium]HIQ09108.1 RNA methyltransferase [Anaerolineaceae bacterium]